MLLFNKLVTIVVCYVVIVNIEVHSSCIMFCNIVLHVLLDQHIFKKRTRSVGLYNNNNDNNSNW